MPLTLKNYRLPDQTISQIADLRETKSGRLTDTAVVIAAVNALHRSVFGRRSADLTPPTIRKKG